MSGTMDPMRIATLRRPRQPTLPGISGVAKVDVRTKNLTKRLHPGDIAIIDHVDLDRVAAESLLERGVAAVVNAAMSISGRYPNLGPEILVAAGVPLIDDAGVAVLGDIREGDVVRIDGESVYVGDQLVAKGVAQTVEQTSEGVTGTAAAIRDAAGTVIGALIVAAPSLRLTHRLAELRRLVREEAATVSRSLGHRSK